MPVPVPSFRHQTRLALNAELTLLEEKLAGTGIEEKRAKLRQAIARNQDVFPQLIELAGRLRFMPARLYPRMELGLWHGEIARLTLSPVTAAETVEFLSLLPAQAAGHSLANHFMPLFGDDPAAFRIFPYRFRLLRMASPLLCSVSWFFQLAEQMALQVYLRLPAPWPERIYDTETRLPAGLLLTNQVPCQWELYDDWNSLILHFPRARARDSGELLTWRNVPLLGAMDASGASDPCLLPKLSPPEPAIECEVAAAVPRTVDLLTKAIRKLKRSAQGRPKKRVRLIRYIASPYQHQLIEAKLVEVVAALEARGVISIDEKDVVTYL